jgi:hypothetical protein
LCNAYFQGQGGVKGKKYQAQAFQRLRAEAEAQGQTVEEFCAATDVSEPREDDTEKSDEEERKHENKESDEEERTDESEAGSSHAARSAHLAHGHHEK